MADTKITALAAITTVDPAADVLPIVDVSDTSMAASGTTKKITSNQILGAGGTATLASATITGDLTVDTSTLKVDSANNRVGIGTASPTQILTIQGAANQAFLQANDSTAVYQAIYGVDSVVGGGVLGCISNHPVIFRVNNTEQMRLNSTGLGVGVTPSNGIRLSTSVATDGAPATSGTTQTSGSLRIGAASTTGAMDMGTAGSYSWIQVLDRTNLATNYNLVLQPNGGNVGVGVTPTQRLHIKLDQNAYTYARVENQNASSGAFAGLMLAASGNTWGIANGSTAANSNSLAFYNDAGGTNSVKMLIDGSGNVGVGVTPSAGKFEVQEAGTGSGLGGIFASTASAGGNPGYVFRTNSVNRWSISITGTAGSESIRFYDVNNSATRMTIDNAGNLILQSSATPATLTVNGQLTVNATSNTNLRFSYRGSDGVTRVANLTLA